MLLTAEQNFVLISLRSSSIFSKDMAVVIHNTTDLSGLVFYPPFFSRSLALTACCLGSFGLFSLEVSYLHRMLYNQIWHQWHREYYRKSLKACPSLYNQNNLAASRHCHTTRLLHLSSKLVLFVSWICKREWGEWYCGPTFLKVGEIPIYKHQEYCRSKDQDFFIYFFSRVGLTDLCNCTLRSI